MKKYKSGNNDTDTFVAQSVEKSKSSDGSSPVQRFPAQRDKPCVIKNLKLTQLFIKTK